jgi:hypothetical protein
MVASVTFEEATEAHRMIVDAGRTRIVGCSCGSFVPRTGNSDDEFVQHVTTERMKTLTGVAVDPGNQGVGCDCGAWMQEVAFRRDRGARHTSACAIMQADARSEAAYLADPNADLMRFRAANHRHMTVFEVLDTANPSNVHVRGWKLWCMNCNLKGERIYQDLEHARTNARLLQSSAGPECRHYRESPAP